jgi:hypothetical protein
MLHWRAVPRALVQGLTMATIIQNVTLITLILEEIVYAYASGNPFQEREDLQALIRFYLAAVTFAAVTEATKTISPSAVPVTVADSQASLLSSSSAA